MKPTLIILLGMVVVGMLVSLWVPKVPKSRSKVTPPPSQERTSGRPAQTPSGGAVPVPTFHPEPPAANWQAHRVRSRLRKGEYPAPAPGQGLGPEWKTPYTEAARAEVEKRLEEAFRQSGYGAFPRLKVDRHTTQGDVERYLRQFKDKDRVKAMFPAPPAPPK